MKIIHAIYENGVFRPLDPVDLPENTHVIVEAENTSAISETNEKNTDLHEILSRRYRSGHHDTAERHDEHMP